MLLPDGATVKAVHDSHVEGLFSRATWVEILSSVGFEVERASTGLGEGHAPELFVCRRAPL